MKVSRICFPVPVYPLFNPKVPQFFGGSELRAYQFGIGLSEYAGNEISFIVPDHGQRKVEQYGKIKVYRHSFYRAGNSWTDQLLQEVSDARQRSHRFPHFHFKVNRLDLLWKPPLALLLRQARKMQHEFGTPLYIGNYKILPKKFSIYRKVNADVYCVFGVSDFAAELAAYCQAAHKRLVLFAGSDMDFSEQYYAGSCEKNPYGSTGALCYYVLQHADLIITQTAYQARLLKERFGRDATTIQNPIDLATRAQAEARKSFEQKMVLWIGKADEVKCPELFLQLAARCAGMRFIMVLNRANVQIFERMVREKPVNVQIIEKMDYAETEQLFSNASVFVNTSLFEGFPNTFLQAGKYGVPVLSLQVDPDDFIKKYTCGIVANGSIDQLVEGLYRFYSDANYYKTCSENIWNYVSDFHEQNSQVKKLNLVLQEFLANGI